MPRVACRADNHTIEMKIYGDHSLLCLSGVTYILFKFSDMRKTFMHGYKLLLSTFNKHFKIITVTSAESTRLGVLATLGEANSVDEGGHKLLVDGNGLLLVDGNGLLGGLVSVVGNCSPDNSPRRKGSVFEMLKWRINICYRTGI